MRLLSAVIFFFCIVTPSFGQSTCEQQIVVNVRDSKGEFVSDLQASSFRAKVGGHEAAVASADLFAGSNRVILVLDASGSMGANDKKRWNAVKSLAEQIIAFAPPSTNLALAMFNTQVFKLGLGHSRNELIAAIDQAPEAKGRTALWNSLLEASEMFGDISIGDSMVVISDFGDDVGNGNAGEVQKAFVAKGIRIFGIGVFGHYFASEEERQGPENLFDLVREAGGEITEFGLSDGNVSGDIGEFRRRAPGLIKWLFDGLGNLYIVRVLASTPSHKRERLNLSIVADDTKKRKGVALSYPQHLNPCAP